MALPLIKSPDQSLMLLETQWKSQLDPVLANPLISGQLLTNIALVSGSNTINHKLGRALQGYIITGMHGSFAQIYDTTSPMPALTLVLHASAATNISLYVF